MKRLSIIIVTYNSEHDIYDCLASLYQHSDIPREELEIIVVDNDSQQAGHMFERIKAIYGNAIKLIKNTCNGGYGQGNNIGIRKATSPIVMIVNPDVRLMEPIFQTALSHFEENPKLSMYGIKQMLTPTQASTNSISFTNMLNGYAFVLLTKLCTLFDWYLPRYMYLQGSCFFVRKSMFEAIGLFDEDVFMYGEEDDIHYRMKEKFGAYFHYNPHHHYQHLTKGRKPDVNYEKKRLESSILLNGKKGYPRKKTIRNYLQKQRVVLLKERLQSILGRKDTAKLTTLIEFRDYLVELLKHEP